MADEPDTTAYSGLKECLSDFQGAYCYRKAIEFICSSLLALTSIVLLGLFIYKYRLQKHTWAVAIVSLMLLCLIANVLFCLFNQTYWLFALETYFFNLYYLAVVSFVCKAYLLKYRQSAAEDESVIRKLLPNSHVPQNLSRDRIIFYSILISMSVLYTVIFVTSIIFEIDPSAANESSKEKYCECINVSITEIWYLCFEGFCILLSIIVMIIMYKNQIEETTKIMEYEEQFKRRSAGSLISKESFARSEKLDNYEERANMINNPLQNLWIWIILNVASQIINLIESGFFLEANPPQCLIIKHNPNSSNVLQLVFVFLTMYMGFIGTIWYNFSINIKSQSVVDRTIHYSQEIRIDGNIELFVPSREQTISFV